MGADPVGTDAGGAVTTEALAGAGTAKAAVVPDGLAAAELPTAGTASPRAVTVGRGGGAPVTGVVALAALAGAPRPAVPATAAPPRRALSAADCRAARSAASVRTRVSASFDVPVGERLAAGAEGNPRPVVDGRASLTAVRVALGAGVCGLRGAPDPTVEGGTPFVTVEGEPPEVTDRIRGVAATTPSPTSTAMAQAIAIDRYGSWTGGGTATIGSGSSCLSVEDQAANWLTG